MITIIKITLGALTFAFSCLFILDFLKKKKTLSNTGWPGLFAVGFITNFFDTLGIGNFAPQTALFKFFKLVEDRFIPGTLNAGNTIPVVLEAFLFISVIKVEPMTLASMLVAAPIGAVIGAGIVAKLPVKKIRIGLGLALFLVAFTMFLGLMKLMPSGGEAAGLNGLKLIFAVIVCFLLGSLHTIGIGFYAPCMALVYSLGMSPKVAFPIMMGAAAMLMPAASMKFVKTQSLDIKASIALTLAGIPGVLLAAYVVTSLPLVALKWVVVAVMVYTALVMFRSAYQK